MVVTIPMIIKYFNKYESVEKKRVKLIPWSQDSTAEYYC